MTSSNSAQHEIGGLEVDAPACTSRACMLETGRPWSEIRSELLLRKAHDFDWRGGRLPIYVYYDNEQLLEVARQAYNLYFSENALGKRAFPSLARMEDEVVGMSLELFHAPRDAAGSFTSGGTESLFLALKTARDRFRARHGSVPRPKIVIPLTAHPAFDKAAGYLGLDVVRTPLRADRRCDVAALAAAIDEQAILIAGSAPCYPFGVYDPCSELAEVARRRGVWLHVDACLGGFLAPFARDEGFQVPDFDFVIDGVTSLSADLHKFGYCAKGASVVLYRSEELKAHQPFRFSNWPRGSYSTETFLGTRPGGSIASAWAVMQYLGRTGYRQLARKIIQAKQRLVVGIQGITGLEVLLPSDLNIVVYRSTERRVDINAVAELMMEKGWFVGRSREPQAIHIAVNAVHAPIIEEYLSDLREAVNRTRLSERTGSFDDATY